METALGLFPQTVSLVAGCVAALALVVLVLRSVWRHYARLLLCRAGVLRGLDWTKAGRWAVITGATDGIGKSFAKELARKGFDIVLISRSIDKLKATAQEIETAYRVKTRFIAVDFNDDISIYERIREELQDLDIGVLVNNVGVSYKYYEYYTKIPNGEQLMEQIFRINIISYTLMTKIVLPGMLKKRSGIIISLSSASAVYPMPYISVYGASKHYEEYLINALREEYKNSGVIFKLVIPHYVVTNMSKIKRATVLTPTADTYARWAMLAIESRSDNDWVPCYGYPLHWIMIKIWQHLGFLFFFIAGCSFEYYFAKKLMVFFKRKHGIFSTTTKTTSG